MNKWVIFRELVREKLESEEHRYALSRHQGVQNDNCAHKAEAYAELLELMREMDAKTDRCQSAGAWG